MKKKLIAVILLLLLLFTINISSIADFGNYSGDSDYDYDSSSDWSDSSDSGGSGGSDNYSSSDSGEWDMSTIAVIAGGVLLIYIYAAMATRGRKKNTKVSEADMYTDGGTKQAPLKSIEEYKRLDPGFDAEELCEKAANLYVRMQNSWTAKDIEPLRTYFTDAFFTQEERLLKGIIKRGETNFVERIAVMDVSLLGFRQTGDEDHILLQLKTRIVDYTVNDSTKELVSGSRDREKFMTYEWDMVRKTGIITGNEDDGVKKIICPSCGAPLDINVSARCAYCGAVVQRQAVDWAICAIRSIRQVTK